MRASGRCMTSKWTNSSKSILPSEFASALAMHKSMYSWSGCLQSCGRGRYAADACFFQGNLAFSRAASPPRPTPCYHSLLSLPLRIGYGRCRVAECLQNNCQTRQFASSSWRASASTGLVFQTGHVPCTGHKSCSTHPSMQCPRSEPMCSLSRQPGNRISK